MMSTILPLLLAALTSLGLLMIVASFAVRPSAFMRIRATETGPRLVGMAEGTILHAMLMDISKRIKPEGEDLLNRLRRSGWIYKSLAEFYARRMYSAFLYMALAVAISFALELFIGASMVPLGSAILGTLGAVYGFSLPHRLVNRAIQRRRTRLLKEMGFGLDRIALFLRSGADIADALAGTRDVGLFGEACGRLASSLSMGRSIMEATDEVRHDLPKTPQFDEFLGMVTVAIQKGQSLVEPFQLRASAMRQRLKLEIIEEGNRARIKVVLITSAVILLASILVTILPTLILLTQEGIV
jgi:Flp pilus assembly protein TadB